MEERTRKQNKPPDPQTGKTVVMPRYRGGGNAPAPTLPDQRAYDNPPPSQRRRRAPPAQPVVEHAPRRSSGRQRTRERNAPPAGAPPTVAPPSRPRRSLWRRVRLYGLLVVLLLFTTVAVGGGLLLGQVGSVAEAVVVPDVRPSPPLNSPLLAPTTILLVGVDERVGFPDEGVRSDTLMLARLHPTNGRISLLSIPRDSLVTLPGVGDSKINYAYGYGYANAEALYGAGTTPQQGGMALAAQTVEGFLGLTQRGMRIDYVAQVNFDGFIGVIDALGGVTIDVPAPIVDYQYPTADFGTMVVEFAPGVQQMDGTTALIYARTRHSDDDFHRGQRQQQVLQAVVGAFERMGWLERAQRSAALFAAVEGQDGAPRPLVTTLPFDRPDVLLGLLWLANGLTSDDIVRVQINPDTVAVTEYGSDLVWDAAGVQQQVDAWLAATTPAE